MNTSNLEGHDAFWISGQKPYFDVIVGRNHLEPAYNVVSETGICCEIRFCVTNIMG